MVFQSCYWYISQLKIRSVGIANPRWLVFVVNDFILLVYQQINTYMWTVIFSLRDNLSSFWIINKFSLWQWRLNSKKYICMYMWTVTFDFVCEVLLNFWNADKFILPQQEAINEITLFNFSFFNLYNTNKLGF